MNPPTGWVSFPGYTGNQTVLAEGTVIVTGTSSNSATLEISFDCDPDRPISKSRPISTSVVTFDPAGGSCDGKSEPWVQKFKGSYDVPGRDDCAKAGFGLVGWTRDVSKTSDADLLTSVVARSVTLYAVWRPVPKAPGAVSSVVNLLCGPCSKAALSWEPSPTEGATYEVVVKGPSGTVTYAATETKIDLVNLVPGATYRVHVHAVKDRVRSDDGASGTQSSTTEFTLSAASIKAIAIVGERGTVSGRSGIIVDGFVTGIEPGKTVIPYVRFPGQTEYAPGSARPVIQADGSFEWSRNTGKKAYVYFTDSDGNVVSNRIIIPAA